VESIKQYPKEAIIGVKCDLNKMIGKIQEFWLPQLIVYEAELSQKRIRMV